MRHLSLKVSDGSSVGCSDLGRCIDYEAQPGANMRATEKEVAGQLSEARRDLVSLIFFHTVLEFHTLEGLILWFSHCR
jgi:hypothetical protein